VHAQPLREIEASGASFLRFPGLRDAHGPLRTAEPVDACAPLRNEPIGIVHGAMLIVRRGNCTFFDKALNAQRAGAVGMVVVDTDTGPVAGFTMSGPEPEDGDIQIPLGIISREEGLPLLRVGSQSPPVPATLSGFEREVFTAHHSRGLALELLPGSGTDRQRSTSWFPGYNYRNSKCRVCNTHLGYFFNASTPHPAHGHAHHAHGEELAGSGDGDGGLRAFHALLSDEVADSRTMHSITSQLRLAPVL